MYLHRTLAGAFALAAATLAFGQQDYPSKTVRIIISFTAGGTTSTLATSATEITGTTAVSGSVMSFFGSSGEITIGPGEDMSSV